MHKIFSHLAFAATLAAVAAPASAQFAKPEDAVKYRQSALSVIKQLFFCKFRELVLRCCARGESEIHSQVDFCGQPLLILFSQDGANQSQAACRVGEQGGDPRSAFDLFVQSFHSIGRAHAHPVLWR